MSVYREQKEARIDTIDPNYKTISICLYVVLYKDETKFSENKGSRRAFVPGQIDDVSDWIDGVLDKQLILDLCNIMWTPESIAAYIETLDE